MMENLTKWIKDCGTVLLKSNNEIGSNVQ